MWWHFVGANTADDGYILTMARVSDHAGYMANYYRWFGTPEAPFGWYYDLLGLWAQVSTASIWVRLPTLLMGLACWWIISREVIPRLGAAVKKSRPAAWTAAAMFLAFWLPLNNGLRPEPIIAVGILLTWCSVERGVATSRLLPVAVAIIIGALTLFSGPTGIAAVGALLVAIGPLRTIVAAHVSRFGYMALLAPIAAAGTVTIFLIFRDQTLVSELQASSFKSTIGPSLAWFDEHIRYSRLFTTSPDGSVARRFAVLTLLLALAISIAMTLRKGRIPGTAIGPTQRMIGITVISFLSLMFTPTKWTHHFGVFAGLAGSIGALAAVAITAAAMSSKRNRTIVTGAILFMTALSFATVNGWWYVSNFGVPWSNDFPRLSIGFTTILLGLAALALLVASLAALLRSCIRGPAVDAVHLCPAGRRHVGGGAVPGDLADDGGRGAVPGVDRGPIQSGCVARQDLWAGHRCDGRTGPERRHAHPDRRTGRARRWARSPRTTSRPTAFPTTSRPTR